jgi:Domain of unknown function (DUF4864)
MAVQSRRQSVRAVLGLIAVVAILVSMRSIYQELRHHDEIKRAQAIEEASRPADWQEQVESARKTVRGQLEAFKKGDWDKAFTYAATSFHEQMHVRDFRQMVESGYPQFARPGEIQVGRGDWHAGAVGVEVTLTATDGGKEHYLYFLAPEEDGWKVTEVNRGPEPGSNGEPDAPAPSLQGPDAEPRTAPVSSGSA